ncbi:ABC transporter six-transmembrane domain-containing protein [Pseudoalteromonas sp. R3]|uniref:ABC transporter six-transmembrane domain-containing protein n=1 Tax=Pseudoalteromonas sp. R3 TaxID=1709477 RepID=UPI0009EA37D7|nr:ABC transporter six-transmembrane domain-containing protein [Pseudoalteromonas sp. R3]AZZ98155.1 ABC transporter permease [Pseudoalteromonas sp. R3]
MNLLNSISFGAIIRTSPVKILLTWTMVILENILLILLPLFIGHAIDGVLAQSLTPLTWFALVLVALVVISVLRRFYDTRVFGDIRVWLAEMLAYKLRAAPVSVKDARLTMSRELVDFLENDLPGVFTAVIQLVATVMILASFHLYLAYSVVLAAALMCLIYALFHDRFSLLNSKLNDQLEQQVWVLSHRPLGAVSAHFERLKRCEIRLSDTEAWVYGLIFLVLFAAVLGNLWMVQLISDISVGQVFSIVTYSLEFVDTAIMLPITLQTLSRLSEISKRLNQPVDTVPNQEVIHDV